MTFAQSQSGTWTLYGFDASHDVHQIATAAIAGNMLTLTGLPAMSANLLVLPGDDIFNNGFE